MRSCAGEPASEPSRTWGMGLTIKIAPGRCAVPCGSTAAISERHKLARARQLWLLQAETVRCVVRSTHSVMWQAYISFPGGFVHSTASPWMERSSASLLLQRCDLRQQILHKLHYVQQHMSPRTPLVLIGHSIGGFMVCVCTLTPDHPVYEFPACLQVHSWPLLLATALNRIQMATRKLSALGTPAPKARCWLSSHSFRQTQATQSR